jgi:hypothetical protein
MDLCRADPTKIYSPRIGAYCEMGCITSTLITSTLIVSIPNPSTLITSTLPSAHQKSRKSHGSSELPAEVPFEDQRDPSCSSYAGISTMESITVESDLRARQNRKLLGDGPANVQFRGLQPTAPEEVYGAR